MDSRIILITVVLSFSFQFGSAQELACGSNPTPRDIRALKSLKTNAVLGDQLASDPVFIAISAHIVRNTNGTGGLTEQELTDAIEDLNSVYSLTNMTFFLFGDINYIDSDEYFDFSSDDESTLTNAHNVENTINVYFMNSATSSGFDVCGYAYFPESGRDHIIMVNVCTTNGSTFPHELGHYFSLYHTHGKTNAGTTDELVDGSNCATAGDDICDTTADPNLTGLVSGSCNYTGTGTDSNGDLYEPNPRNLMSYAPKQCRDEFSQEQADRIVLAYQTYKTYLLSKDYAAAFDVNSRAVCQGESLTFTSKSVGAVSYAWTFAGGTPSSSSEENPTITYNTIGDYDVSLVITESGGDMDTKAFSDYITVKESVTSVLTEKSGSFEEAGLEEEVINDDDGITFAQSTSSSNDGAKSVFMDFLIYEDQGEVDYLIMSALNTSALKSFTLTFDYAYAPYSDSFFDGLAIVYRDPCDEWVTVWEKFGSELQTTSAQTNEFVPATDDWVTEEIAIEIPEEIAIAEIAFKAINGYGNNLYIDNYQIIPMADFTVDEFQVTDASCFDSADGAITVVTTSNGSLSYSQGEEAFTSSNVFTGLTQGAYTISVKNEGGITLISTVTVGAPDELLAEVDAEGAPCGENGAAFINVNGGSGNYNFDLDGVAAGTSPSISNVGVGSHTVVVTDMDTDCTTEVSFTIIEVEAAFEISLENIKPSCPDATDGAIAVTGLPSGYEFSMNEGSFSSNATFENLGMGTYTLRVVDSNGCEKGVEVELEAENEYPDKPVIIRSNDELSIELDEMQTVQWFLDGALLVGATENTLNANGSGTYSVEVSYGVCSTLSDSFLLLSNNDLQDRIDLYPNPVMDQLTIVLPKDLLGKVESFIIRDFSGKVVQTEMVSEQVSVQSLSSGMYLLEVSGERLTLTKRFLKR